MSLGIGADPNIRAKDMIKSEMEIPTMSRWYVVSLCTIFHVLYTVNKISKEPATDRLAKTCGPCWINPSLRLRDAWFIVLICVIKLFPHVVDSDRQGGFKGALHVRTVVAPMCLAKPTIETGVCRKKSDLTCPV